MIFRRAKESEEKPAPTLPSHPSLLIITEGSSQPSAAALDRVKATLGGIEIVVASGTASQAQLGAATAVVTVFSPTATVDSTMNAVRALRRNRNDGLPVLIICVSIANLAELGAWLQQAAVEERLEGIRLVAASTADEALYQVPSRLGPITEPNIIKMPASTEVDCKDFKYFYAISPDLRNVVRFMRELAENNIARVYLLGAPGAGKTSLAYYFYLCRAKGNFVSVNLTAESTGDKESMKSLLCGHVTGAFVGASSREGVLSFAGDGVAFLDESHGVTGVVMQVLMEVLDSGQFLPFGATKKRALESAVIFASNRSWEALREMMNLDEHARLGATIVKITDLASREEDLIAVLSITLARFAKQCTSWKPPQGLTPGAWHSYRTCRWRGNTRTLIRVTETAAVAHASAHTGSPLIENEFVKEALSLWEPETHSTMDMYTSIPGSGDDTQTVKSIGV